MANVKTVQIRRNLAPNAYYLDMQVNERLMQEYDTQTGTWTPAVTVKDTWRTLITAMVKTVSVDGTKSAERIGIASYQYLFRIAGEAEWKDLSEIPTTNGREQLNSLYNSGLIYLRHCANIPAGVTYEVKCVAVVADEDIRQAVMVESDIYRIGCNDKTMDEIRFRLVKGQQNIIYNPEAPGPYTVKGLERATFLQQCEFEVTKGGKAFWSDDLVVACEDVGKKTTADEGVTLEYNFEKWTSLYVENNTAPAAETDQIGNSVHFVDRYIGLHSDTWAINKGGLFTYASGARKMDILWRGNIKSITLWVNAGTSGTTPSSNWVKLDKEGMADIRYYGDSLVTVEISNIQNSDSITGKGITLTVARNLVITKIKIDGVDAEDVMTVVGPYRFKGKYIENAEFSKALMADICTRYALQKLEKANGTVRVAMDCGAMLSGGTALRLYNKDRTVLYDERVISFRRKVPQLEVSVENLPFIESKKNAMQKMWVRLYAEGHEVTEYRYYTVAGTTKKADGDTGSLALADGGLTHYKDGTHNLWGFEFGLSGTAEGTVTFEPKMKEVLEVI